MATGSILVTSPVGSEYEYSIDGVSFQTAGLFENLTSDNYTVTVRNSEGCISSALAVIDISPAFMEKPVVSIIQPNCNEPTGTIRVDSDKTDLMFSLNGSAFATYPAQGYTDLIPGMYLLNVRNSDGCTSTINIEIPKLSGISGTATVSNILCFGENTGTISLQITPFNNPSFLWSNGETGNSITNLKAGPHSVTVIDDNGCKWDTTIFITQPDDQVLVTELIKHVGIYGGSNGSIQLNVHGGTPAYRFEWINETGNVVSSNKDLLNVSAGSYTVIVTDANNCISEYIYNVLQPDANLTLWCPDPITICPNGILPLEFSTYAEFVARGGKAETNCPQGIDENSFRLIDTKNEGPVCDRTISRIYQISDNCGNVTTCTHIIRLEDKFAPMALSPAPVLIECYSDFNRYPVIRNTQQYLEQFPGYWPSDNCTAPQDLIIKSYGQSALEGTKCDGLIRRWYTFTDACGNESGIIEVQYRFRDNTPPIVSAERIRNLKVEVGCTVPKPYANLQAFNEAAGSTVYDCNNVKFAWAGDKVIKDACPMIVERTYTFTDDCGNVRPFVQTITVVDEIPPVFAAISPFDGECSDPDLLSNIQTWLNGVSATDVCYPDVVVTNNFSSLELPKDGCGSVTVTFTATDICGNTSTAFGTINLNDSTIPIFNPIANLILPIDSDTRDNEISEWLNSVVTIDNCTEEVTVQNNFAEQTLPTTGCGTIIITFTSIDNCGNLSTTTANITFTNSQKPEFIAIEPFVAECSDENLFANIEVWLNNIKSTDPAAIITHDFVYEKLPKSGCGTIPVRFLATDECGNTTTIESTITITDSEAPIFDHIIPFEAECSSLTLLSDINSWLRSVSATDNCGKVIITNNFDINNLPATGCETIVITFVAEDECGNRITIESTITIIDSELPVFAEIIPFESPCNNPSLISDIQSWLKGISVSDNCGIPTVMNDFDILQLESAGACGIIPVTFTATDNCGNISTLVSTIMITDTEAPILICPPNMKVECLTDAPAPLTINDFIARNMVSDNCALDANSFAMTEQLNRTDQQIVITRTYSIADMCGNESSCTQTIELSDFIPPVVECRDITVFLDENGRYEVLRDDVLVSASDNCTPYDKLEIIADPPVLTCDDIGKTILVKITVIDEAGNKSECESKITVLDKEAPVALCQDITVVLDDRGMATISVTDIDNGSFDNCSIESMWISKTTFNCNDTGENIVRLTVRDTSGNTDWCEAIVTVVDNNAPTAICQDIDLQLGPSGKILLTPPMIDNGSYDECGIKEMRLSRTLFTCEDVGENIVTLYVYDPFGNVDSCTAIVTVWGNLPPIARDDNVKALANQNTMILVLLNDNDPDGQLNPASLWITRPPENGSVTVSPSGVVTYKPFENFMGTDSFTYRICDDGNYCGELCDTALVTITVVAENMAPIAVDDYFEGGCLAISGNILRNDYDPDGDNIILNKELLLKPHNGELEMFSDGSFLYISDKGFVGIDSLRYQICDDGFPVKCDTATVYFDIFLDENCDGIADDEGQDFFIPEGFSPNADGVHDFFQIVGIEEFPDAKMMIFNRWGNKIFEKEKYGNLNFWGSHEEAWWWGISESRWNVGSGRVPVGNYLYILELGNGTTFKGTVMVSY